MDAEAAALPYEAVVHITNSDAVPALNKPWKVLTPRTSTGTGFCIGERRILTNHHVVRDSTTLRVFKHGVPGSYAATVLCESAVSDLALVTVDDDSFWSGLPAVTFQQRVPALDDEGNGPKVELGTVCRQYPAVACSLKVPTASLVCPLVCAVGYPLGAKSVSNTRGVVGNVAMMDLTDAVYEREQQLCVQIDAALNPGNSGGPVFNKSTGEVVGVAFAGRDDAEGIGFIIPTPVVDNFLAANAASAASAASHEDGRLPCLGIHFQPLVNRALRSLVLAAGGTPPAHHNGILVQRVVARSCASAAGVRPGDVLVAIDGTPVSEEGEVPFRDHERVSYEYLITSRRCGESVTVSLLRSRHAPPTPTATFDLNRLAEDPCVPTPLELRVTLSPAPEAVPRELHKDYFPRYLILGGLTFVVAGTPLLDQGNWRMEAAIDELLKPPPAALDGHPERGSGVAAGAGGGSGGSGASEDRPKLDGGLPGSDGDVAGNGRNDRGDGNAGDRSDGHGEQREVLLCSSCLAHEVNETFDSFVGERLWRINGVAVRSMAHAVALVAPLLDPTVEPPPRTHCVLQFYQPRAAAVFEVAALRAAMPTIMVQHKVPSWTNVPHDTAAAAAVSHAPGGSGGDDVVSVSAWRGTARRAAEALGSDPPEGVTGGIPDRPSADVINLSERPLAATAAAPASSGTPRHGEECWQGSRRLVNGVSPPTHTSTVTPSKAKAAAGSKPKAASSSSSKAQAGKAKGSPTPPKKRGVAKSTQAKV